MLERGKVSHAVGRFVGFVELSPRRWGSAVFLGVATLAPTSRRAHWICASFGESPLFASVQNSLANLRNENDREHIKAKKGKGPQREESHPTAELSSSVAPRASKMGSSLDRLSPVKNVEVPGQTKKKRVQIMILGTIESILDFRKGLPEGHQWSASDKKDGKGILAFVASSGVHPDLLGLLCL